MDRGARNWGKPLSGHALTSFDGDPQVGLGVGLGEASWKRNCGPLLSPPSAPAWDHLRPPYACRCLGLRRGGNRGCGLGSTAAQSGDWELKRLCLLSGWWTSHRRKAERLHSHPRGRLWHLPRGHLAQPQALARAQPSEGNLSEGPHPWPRWVGKLRLRPGVMPYISQSSRSFHTLHPLWSVPLLGLTLCVDFKTWGSERDLKISYFESVASPLLKFLFESSTLSL